jgi:hypothetical protein
VYLFCCYLLDVYTAPLPSKSSNRISPLYGTHQSTCECTVPCPISCTSAAFQFHSLPNDISLPLYDEMKLGYWNSLWTHRKLNAVCISAAMEAFGCDHRKENILLQLQWKGLGLMYKRKNFLSSLLNSESDIWRVCQRCESYEQKN